MITRVTEDSLDLKTKLLVELSADNFLYQHLSIDIYQPTIWLPMRETANLSSKSTLRGLVLGL